MSNGNRPPAKALPPKATAKASGSASGNAADQTFAETFGLHAQLPDDFGSRLKEEIAAAAARMIAEEGMDYATAKRKAQEQITGGRRSRHTREALPSNEEVEDAVREYQQIFQSDTQPARLLALRIKALALMRLLKDFSPTVTGAVANGTAGEFTDLHLQCFADNAKALGIFLIDQGIPAQATTLPHFRGDREEVEALVVHWQGEVASIAVYSHLDQRGAMKPNARGRIQRLDIPALAALINATQAPDA
jgi:hypothetical protein